MNDFLKNVSKNDTHTENGAIAHSTTGSAFVDQFSKAGSYRGRDIAQVFAEQSAINAINPTLALKFVFYLRMITRKVKFTDGTITETTQKGTGNRDESFKRFLYYLQNHPKVFYNNLILFTEVGSVKDVFSLVVLAKENDIAIDLGRVYNIILTYQDSDINLLLKYMPAIKAKSKVKTIRGAILNGVAKGFSRFCKLTPKEYRQIKTRGQAHKWQQLISKGLQESIDFNAIPGKALLLLVSGKAFQNWGILDKYQGWLKNQTAIKFNGHVHELGQRVTFNNSKALRMTIDKQFESLIQEPIKSKRRIISAIDRSGSMSCKVANTTAMNIAESLGIYFSSLLEGEFKDWVIKFSERSQWIKLVGTFSEKKLSMNWHDCPSNTDFQSIINSFVRVRQERPEIPESDFPDTLLIVSDMQFDGSGSYYIPSQNIQTEYQIAVEKLKTVFSKEYCDNFVFIWWDCTGRRPDNQPQNIDEPGGYFMSGFDGSVLNLLLSNVEKKASVEKSIQDILNQEALNRIIV